MRARSVVSRSDRNARTTVTRRWCVAAFDGEDRRLDDLAQTRHAVSEVRADVDACGQAAVAIERAHDAAHRQAVLRQGVFPRRQWMRERQQHAEPVIAHQAITDSAHVGASPSIRIAGAPRPAALTIVVRSRVVVEPFSR
jgi:hypothetical protein